LSIMAVLEELHLGCCITPHGFGHAARVTAVLAALSRRVRLHCTIVTRVPRWFFHDCGVASLQWHDLQTDVGFVQKSSLEEDMAATRSALDGFYPLDDDRIDRACQLFAGCDCILSDIAPLGIAAAARLGIPSVLLENFTWDWIYRAYSQEHPFLIPHIAWLEEIYARADHHLQAQPVCHPVHDAVPLAPVYRAARTEPRQIREYFRIEDTQPVILLTMGGIRGRNFFVDALQRKNKYVFLLAGTGEREQRMGNVYQIPAQTPLYHPDLIRAADLVIGKLGYSTVAEVYGAGTPFAFVGRPSFPESGVLASFVTGNRMGREIEHHAFVSGEWLEQLDELLALPRFEGNRENGAEQAAEYLLARVCRADRGVE